MYFCWAPFGCTRAFGDILGSIVSNSHSWKRSGARVMTLFVCHATSALIFLILDILKYMRVYGGIWRYMRVYEGIWRYMKYTPINGGVSPWHWANSGDLLGHQLKFLNDLHMCRLANSKSFATFQNDNHSFFKPWIHRTNLKRWCRDKNKVPPISWSERPWSPSYDDSPTRGNIHLEIPAHLVSFRSSWMRCERVTHRLNITLSVRTGTGQEPARNRNFRCLLPGPFFGFIGTWIRSNNTK